MISQYTGRAKAIPLTGHLILVYTGAQYSWSAGGDTYEAREDHEMPDMKSTDSLGDETSLRGSKHVKTSL